MEQEAELSTSSSEHLAIAAGTASVSNSTTPKKKSAKSRLAQPFKSLVGRSASLRSKPDEEAAPPPPEASGAASADTLPRATSKSKKQDKKSKAKAAQSGDESKSKDAVLSAEENTEEGKRSRKKKSSIVRRLSNKIRTTKQEQESGATSEMSAADMTSEDANSVTSSSTYGAKTPEHPSLPPPSSVAGKESEEEWVSSREAHSESEKPPEPQPPPPPSPVETPAPIAPKKRQETPPPPPQVTPEPVPPPPASAPEELLPSAPEAPPPVPPEDGADKVPIGDPSLFPTTDLAQNGERREHLYKILVIGELGTGKTSIIKRYVHQFFSQHYRATIGVDFALKVLTWDQNTIIRLQLWDIAGQERFGNMTRVYYKEAVGAFIVFDVTRTATFDAVLKWKADLDSKVQLPDGSPIPCVLLANKCDQQKEGIANTPAKMDEYCKDNGFAGWYETSAKENINIDEAARFLVSKILQNDRVANVTSNKEDGFSLDRADGEQSQKSCPC